MKFLCTADWHLRGEGPVCRLDEDWLEAQRNNVRFVVDYANEQELPIYNIGDLFHTPRTATETVNMLIEELSKAEHGVRILVGNHDIPYHDYSQLSRSSIGTILHKFIELQTSPALEFCAFPFGLDKPSCYPIRFIHRLVFENDKARPMEGCGTTAKELLEEFPDQKWIFCGDMHHAFHFEKDGRHVLNPGCLNIQVSDMADYKPRFAVVDTDIGAVKWVYIPQPVGMVDVSHNLEKHERDVRMGVFVEKIQSTQRGVSLSFWNNLETAMSVCSDGIQGILTKVKEKVTNESK